MLHFLFLLFFGYELNRIDFNSTNLIQNILAAFEISG